MNDIPEFLERELHLALWQRVSCGVDLADFENTADLELDILLATLRRLLDIALYQHRGARGGEARERVHGGINDDLERGSAGTVAELEEGEGALPLLSARPNPSPDHDALPGPRGARCEDIADAGADGGGLQVVAERGRVQRRCHGVGGHGDGDVEGYWTSGLSDCGSGGGGRKGVVAWRA